MGEDDRYSLDGGIVLIYSYTLSEKNSITNTNKQSGLDIQGCHRYASGFVRPRLTGKMIRAFFDSVKRKLLLKKHL